MGRLLRSRTTWTALVALTLHLAVIASFRRLVAPPPVAAAAVVASGEPTEVDITDTVEPPSQAAEQSGTHARSTAVARGVRVLGGARPAAAGGEGGREIAGEEAEGTPAGAGESGVAAAPLRTDAIDLSLKPADRLALAEKGFADRPPVSNMPLVDPSTRPIADGRGGPILAAIEEAAHDGSAPATGIAVFDVAVRRDGSVSVNLSEASSNWTGWSNLRPSIQQSVAGRPIRMPPGGRGIRVVVRVEAKHRFPGGAQPVTESAQGLSAGASLGKLHEAKDRIVIEPPSVTLAYRGRKCGVGVKISPTGIGGGAGCAPGVEMRVVEARIVGEGLL